MRNPFKYGVRVSGSSFFDRAKVKRAMLNTLDGGCWPNPPSNAIPESTDSPIRS